MNKVLIAVAVLILTGCNQQPSPSVAPQTLVSDSDPSIKRKIEEERRVREMTSDCQSSRAQAAAEYQQLIGEHPWDAAKVVRECALFLKDKELMEMLQEAEVKGYGYQIQDKSLGLETRLKSIELLAADYPDQAQKYQKLKQQMEMAVEGEDRRQAAESQRLSKLAEKREAAKRKSQGVSLGMTPDEVMASNWGRPRRVTRSQSSYISTEMWDYGYPNFLYFVNGRLEQIHN